MTKKSDAPAIRFKGFSDAWEQRKFSDITFPAGEKNKDNLPLESYSITNEHGFVPQDEKFENGGTMREADKRMYYIVSPNSFAYNPARINVGSIGYQNIGKNVIVSSLYEVFKTSEDVDDRLLWHWFKSADFQKLIMQLQEGGVRLYFYYDKLCMGEVSLPSLDEQRKIGKLFDTLDNLITLHQRECISFTARAGRLILTANKKRNTSSWEQRKLGDVVQITMGQSPDGSTYSDEPSDYILVQGNADLQNGWVCPRIWTTQITKKADAGDLIMSVRAPAGAMGKTAYNAVIGRGVAAIKGNEFIYQLLVKMDADGFWKTLSCGSTFESLNSDNIKNAEVKIPTTAEQIKIGGYFQQLDNLITLHQRQPFSHSTPDISLSVQLIHPFYTSSWEQRKAIDIADYSKGNGYSKGDLTDAGTPIILYGRLYTKYQFAISEVDTFAVPRNGAVYSQGNEVIVPASGETAEDIARASAVEKSGVLLGGDLNILRPFDFINPLFLALAISNGEPQKELAKKAQGKSVVHIHNTDIQEVTIAYPSRTEQDRIVSVFRQLDHLITLHQRKGKAAVSGCSNDANNSKGVCCKARDFGYKCHKKDESK